MQKQPAALLNKALTAIVFAFFGLLIAAPVLAQNSTVTQLQAVPALTARVMDRSGTLSSTDIQSLSDQLQQLETNTGTQIAVLMVNTTAPEDIAAYAYRVASEWKLGRKDIGDGLLIIVAKSDRLMRIEVARALKGSIPDLMAARIIDNAMKPRFRDDDYAGGLSAAIKQLGQLIHGEKLPAPTSSSTPSAESGSDFGITSIALFWLFGAPLARWLLGRSKASLLVGAATGVAVFVMERSLQIAAGAAVIAMVLTFIGWFGLLRSGGGKGGGFKSGGGGRFGGGGASGGW